MTKHTVYYGEQEIRFELEIKPVKNINLNVRPDQSITVSANKNVPLDVIIEFVKAKGQWISKNLAYFQNFQRSEGSSQEYVSGESFKYLGRQHRLRVRKSQIEEVKYFRGFIYLYVRDPSDLTRKKRFFQGWLRKKTEHHFALSLKRMYVLVKPHDLPLPKLRIREMKARWGSCHRDTATIVLNADLIKAPKHCIDYVILHELIHFKYRGHNNEFYTLLTSLMPDWEKRKRILDEEVIRDL